MTDAHRVDVTSKCCLYLKKLTYSPKRVCYTTSSLPNQVCVIGDSYTLSRPQTAGVQYSVSYSFTLRNPTTNAPFLYANPYTGVQTVTGTVTHMGLGINCATVANETRVYFCGKDVNGNNKWVRVSTPFGQSGISTKIQVNYLNATRISGQDPYKIEIKNAEGVIIHEAVYPNPINAWIDPEQCEESEEWYLEKCWEQLPDDFVFVDIGGNSRTFYKISRQNLWIHCPDTATNDPNFPNSIDVFNCLAENPPFAFREDSVIYVDRKPPDCPFPAYKIECDPCSNDDCENPDPPCEVVDCPEGYYFDDLDCICKVVPDPCPDGYRWVKQPYSDGYCIPEDECEFKECPDGYYWSVEDCDCLPYDPCPEGWYRNELGYCVPRQGCTDPSAHNYDPEAVQDDGSCVYKGCTDPDALNYNPRATIPDFCLYPPPPPKKGCTDPEAYNYDPLAQVDDGSCVYKGCMDENALNYDPQATIPDGSCIYPPDPPRLGCTDPFALNYDPLAEIDDGTCIYPDPVPPKKGCTNPFALNFDPEAEVDDGSCRFRPPTRPPEPPCETRECSDGYYFDSVDCICKPIPIYPPPPDDNDPPSVEYPPPPSECQTCPPETTCSFICNGIVCCYDKNFCLIAYFPESLLC